MQLSKDLKWVVINISSNILEYKETKLGRKKYE